MRSRYIEPEIVSIPAGAVLRGVPECPPGAKVPHAWSIRETYVPAFSISKYAVTVEEYLLFAEVTGYPVAEGLFSDPRFKKPRASAAYVSWIDAARYAQWLAREYGKPYRLVRDAEYEKAARGGLVGKQFPWGDEPPEGRADFGNSDGGPQPVGSLPPNGYGLYDMVGSIWSWCEECFNQVVHDDLAKMCYEDTLIKDTRLNLFVAVAHAKH